MKDSPFIPPADLVLDVAPFGTQFRVRCPCCGREGFLVRAVPVAEPRGDVNGRINRYEVRVELVVDVPQARHSTRSGGTRSFMLRLVEKLSPPRPGDSIPLVFGKVEMPAGAIVQVGGDCEIHAIPTLPSPEGERP